MIELKKISKAFNIGTVTESVVFKDFDFSVETGDFASVVGSNGSGKTTLLNIICGSIPIESGCVITDGADITKMSEYKRYRKIGRVYQNPSVGSCADMTINENMSLAENKGKRFDLGFGVNKARLEHYRSEVADLGLGLEDKMNVKMGALSGGQRQAVSLLMATITPIDILILDEHTAALDPKTADVIMELTSKVVTEKKLTALMVTHNLRYAVEYGNRLVMLHEGKIILDKRGEEKKATSIKDVLGLFNSISIECGN